MLKFAKRLTMFALLATTTVLGGCGGDDPVGPTTLTGTYALETLNGQELPFTTVDDAEFQYKEEVVGSTLTFRGDRTWTETILVRVTDGDAAPVDEPETLDGTYTRSGNSLALRSGEGDLVATIQGNGDIVIAVEGLTGRYTRQ